MKKIIVIITAVMACAQASVAETQASEQNQKPKKSTNTYVLIVSGVNKDPEEQQAKDKAVIKLRKFFLDNAKAEPGRVMVLVDANSFARKGAEVSTVRNMEKTIAKLAAAIKPADRFIFYYVGQANIVTGKLRLNLPGEDVTHQQLAGWINKIKASSVLIVLDCPGAGLAVKALTGPGRIVICGARSDQPYSTRFSRYFIPALLDPQSDEDGDGRICLLEAFTHASKQLDDLYRQQDLLKTETPLLEDDGDGVPSQQPWRYKQDNNDGLAASRFFMVSDINK